MDLAAEVAALDAATVEPIVARAVGRDVVIGEWLTVPFSYQVTNALSAGIFRLSGTASDGSDWSVILKVLQPAYDVLLARFPAESRAELEDAYLWDREVRAYESGLFERLPHGFAAPRALAIDRRSDGSWLWLEDLGVGDARWDIGRYALAARHLGRFNGAFPAGVFDAAWLTRTWLSTWLLTGFGSRAQLVLDNDAIWAHPYVRAGFASDARDRLRRVWPGRAAVLARLLARPQTLCHLDAFRKNLFDRNGETVAIDWSYVGIAPVGVEVGHLVMGSVAFAEHGHDTPALAAAALDAYLDGLRESGWQGDELAVREGYALSAIRWVFMLGWLGAVLDPAWQARMEQWAGQPLADQVAEAGARTTYLLDLIDGALS
ncbi:MAG: hypothetical protein M3O64_03595 [Chloroflexota bacterium]|nr:hypothetical protein [Chloroflexota bacterium]